MSDPSCIFCKIIKNEIKSDVIKENDFVKVIKDAYPKAPIHYLIIPKKHITDLSEINDNDYMLGWHMLKMARDLAKDKLNDLKGFNLIANNGKTAGQSVMHLHFHFLAGKNIYEGELKL